VRPATYVTRINRHVLDRRSPPPYTVNTPLFAIRSCDLYTKSARRVPRNALLAIVTAAISAAAIANADAELFKEPQHDSALAGRAWLQEHLDSSSPHKFKDTFGVSRFVYLKALEKLCEHSTLKDRCKIDMEEMLACFLYFIRTNAGVRQMADRFNCSPETVHMCVTIFLFILKFRQ
jgi:hypothetical protein